MSNIEFASESTVKLLRHSTADEYVIQAAQVSAQGDNDLEELARRYEAEEIDIFRFINALMKGRHGSPFEHTYFNFFVEAPLFVFREWQRHRMSSFNEMSGRYTTLKPKFYIPDESRKLVNSGSKMKPKFISLEEGREKGLVSSWLHGSLAPGFKNLALDAWQEYQAMLEGGIANEVARMVLPLNIYSQMYWSVNARSLMNFLSLRVQSEDSTYPSYPQYEIDQPAREIEKIFAELMPATHKAFVQNGRVAP